MALETSPRPAPRPLTTDLPYGAVDRLENVAVELIRSGEPVVAGTVVIFSILLVIAVAIAWRANRLRPVGGRTLSTPQSRRPRTEKSPRPIAPRAVSRPPRTLKPQVSPPPRSQGTPREPRYPIRTLPEIPPCRTLTGKCYVIDGDTIIVKQTKIRLAGIDAPELDRPFGKKSMWEMRKICKGQVISVQLNGERSHDRLVGVCYLPDGTDIGAELIRRGLALDWTMFSGGRYRHLEPPGVRAKLTWARHSR